jgi:filamentous hemagglutinin
LAIGIEPSKTSSENGANEELVANYRRVTLAAAYADHTFEGEANSTLQFFGDLLADPADVGIDAIKGAIQSFDENVLLNDTPVLEYAARAGKSAEDFANASPDEQAEIVGKGLGITAFAAVEVVVGTKGAGQLVPGKSPDIDTGGTGTSGGNDGPDKPSSQERGAEFEEHVGEDLGDDVEAQVPFLDGERVEGGGRPAGSSVPDYCDIAGNCFIEVKSFDLSTPAKITSLISSITRQARQRLGNLPEGARQQVLIDVRGQNVSDATRNNIVDRIVRNSNGAIKREDIDFVDE